MPDAIGLVLAGGGARGAYEAGVLRALLPALAERGERPGIVVGTSVGALNAAYLATNADEDAATLAENARTEWLDLLLGCARAVPVSRRAGDRVAADPRSRRPPCPALQPARPKAAEGKARG